MMRRILAAAVCLMACLGSSAADGIYHKGWIDFNKNGRKDVFEDKGRSIDERVEDLLDQMNWDEKTCQLATLYGYKRVLKDSLPTPQWKNEIWKDGIANIDEQLTFTLTPEDLALLDKDMKWTMEPGDFTIMVGASSTDIRLKQTIRL